MIRRLIPSSVLCVCALFLSTGCHIIEVYPDGDREQRGSIVRADGLIRGHAGIVPPDEDRIVNLSVLDGSSPGAVAEIVIWKLLRVEAGLAGVSLGVGPLTLGIGTLFYDPIVPSAAYRDDDEDEEEHDHDDHDDHDHDDHEAMEEKPEMPGSSETRPKADDA